MARSPSLYERRLTVVADAHRRVLTARNRPDPRWDNGWYTRYVNPVLTNRHVPLHWRYDLNPKTNPRFLERLGVNAVFNSGAIEHDGQIYLMARVEGFDRKSFFALAASQSGVDRFRFVGKPIVIPETDDPATNVYDMRLTRHEDGWIYGVFCVERKDPAARRGDLSSAVAQCGIARSRDLDNWERLADICTPSPQQRNVVLHPEFVQGQYLFYTRPQDGFIDAGSGGGIAWGLAPKIEQAVLDKEHILDERAYHTIKETKNGMGGVPLKTPAGWLHIDHGVRGCASGLRYVLYAFLCDLADPGRKIAAPGGYFLAPFEEEFPGDVANVTFSNGLVGRANGQVLIYYGSADTRLHVATSDVETLLDYVHNTPPDPLRTFECVQQRRDLAERNLAYLKRAKSPLLKGLL